MNLQHTKVRNRLEPHRVEKLLYIQINKQQFRTEQPPEITQEFLLEEDDNEIERVLQRKQVRDHLSEGSVTSDTSSNPVSSPTPSPTPGVGSSLVSTLDINPDLNPEPEPESNLEQGPEPISAPNSAPTSALVSALNSRLNCLLKPNSEPLPSPTTSTPNSAHPIRPSSVKTSTDKTFEVSNTKGKKRLSEWPQGVTEHCEQPAQRRGVNKG
ncbi:hypothetical protein N7466_002976 [Penicillium verhagenii]|uniref:uncharacterized protein n=1 Tax=Penicillium verhagenii TaxID=1562060 RepID=UPI0025456146|nr:uncharacterized protein N7466_002976 [Penicillium verhagenii]KAJ5936526.1 hypothetical protein N7466_002976 [Penicillium verhagenii]